MFPEGSAEAEALKRLFDPEVKKYNPLSDDAAVSTSKRLWSRKKSSGESSAGATEAQQRRRESRRAKAERSSQLIAEVICMTGVDVFEAVSENPRKGYAVRTAKDEAAAKRRSALQLDDLACIMGESAAKAESRALNSDPKVDIKEFEFLAYDSDGEAPFPNDISELDSRRDFGDAVKVESLVKATPDYSDFGGDAVSASEEELEESSRDEVVENVWVFEGLTDSPGARSGKIHVSHSTGLNESFANIAAGCETEFTELRHKYTSLEEASTPDKAGNAAINASVLTTDRKGTNDSFEEIMNKVDELAYNSVSPKRMAPKTTIRARPMHTVRTSIVGAGKKALETRDTNQQETINAIYAPSAEQLVKHEPEFMTSSDDV